jgi:hypothetical protein
MFDLSGLEKHKKTIGIVCLAVFIGSFLVKYAVNRYRQIADGHHPPPVRKPLTPQEIKAMGFAQMAGIWEAQGYLKGSGNCRFRLELRQAQGLYRGDTRFACLNLDLKEDPIKMMAERSAINTVADTAILAGKVENDAIHLKATKIAGSNWCAIKDLTLTPGGTELIAEWTDCNGGHLNLKRSAR